MARGIKDKVAILGMGCSKFGERWDSNAQDLMVEAFEEALKDAGIGRQQIEAAWLGTALVVTVATSFTSTGVPLWAETTMLPISSADRSSPSPRIRYCWEPRSVYDPPAFALPRPSAVKSCCSVRL